ncbi:MAG TPA: M56 family metallopeptidase [Pirellulales bacterium]|nr:M56 family metallopeptidase [Pirellulales bacterium]
MDNTLFLDPLSLCGVLQPTLWLLMALAAGLAWPRRPARAHTLALLALTGLLLSPPVTLAAHRFGWGILPPPSKAEVPLSGSRAPVTENLPVLDATDPGRLEQFDDAAATPRTPPARANEDRSRGPTAPARAIRALWPGWRYTLVAAWCLASAGLVVRVVVAGWRARYVLRRRTPVEDAALHTCLDEAAARLDLRAVPMLAAADVGVPVIWCWGRRPLVLVPVGTVAAGPIDWVGVFRHELAHWKRRDHLARSIARLATIVFPLHPLTWIAAWRLHALSERACDVWAVADGRSPLDYAESLLLFSPQSRPRLSLAAVSCRRLFSWRVRRLLDHRSAPPETGRRWLVGMTVFTVLLVAVMAVAQPPAGREVARDGRPSPTAKMTVTGRVLLPDGEPAAGAQVAVAGRRRWPSHGGDADANDSELLGSAVVDDAGNFEMEAPRASSADFLNLFALAGLDGYARGMTVLNRDAERPIAVIRLNKEDPLRAKLIDLQGAPAAGVEFFVERIGIERWPESMPGFVEDIQFHRPPERLPLWPRRMKSDERGRVTLAGFGRGSVVFIVVDDPRFARQRIMLGGSKAEAEPTVSLAQPQIVEGTVTYADTGAPAPRARLTGGLISGGGAVADDRGHYRIDVGGPGLGPHITASAPDGAPYLTVRKSFKWPPGAAKHQVDVALPRGVLAQGRVVDQAGEAVAGAMVQYIPLARNPHRNAALVFGRNNVGMTDAHGSFSLPVLPGTGHLLVQGPNGDFIHQEIGSLVIDDDQPGGTRYYPDALVRLDIPADKESVRADATLRRGVTVRGRLAGPNGEPVRRALVISCLQLVDFKFYGLAPTEVIDGNFELHGLDPEQSYSVMFSDLENEWATTASISGRQAGELVTVRLEPCGTVSARFVGKDGKPMAGLRPWIELVVTPGVGKYEIDAQRKGSLAFDGEHIGNLDRERHFASSQTDDMGRLSLAAMIPGATYRIFVTVSEKVEFTVESGKKTELGDITIPRPGE